MRNHLHLETLLLRAKIVLLALTLSGCIFTTEPAFDAESSVAAHESVELNAFIDATIGLGFTRFTPFFGSKEAPGHTRVFHIAQRHIFLQFAPPEPGCPAADDKACAMYYSVGFDDTGRPRTCFVDVEKGGDLEAAAASSGVTLSIQPATTGKGGPFGPDVLVEGEGGKVRAFIIDRLENGPLKCQVWEPETSK